MPRIRISHIDNGVQFMSFDTKKDHDKHIRTMKKEFGFVGLKPGWLYSPKTKETIYCDSHYSIDFITSL